MIAKWMPCVGGPYDGAHFLVSANEEELACPPERGRYVILACVDVAIAYRYLGCSGGSYDRLIWQDRPGTPWESGEEGG